MICQQCNQRDASVHVMQSVNGHLSEQHLCHVCAAAQYLPTMLTGKQLLEQFMPASDAAQRACPHCGTTLKQFQQTGFLGCAQCYAVFEEQIGPMLLAVHGTSEHLVAPKAAQGEASSQPDDAPPESRTLLPALRELLRGAIQEERYEQAAQLRDRIHAIERGENA